ncbi:dUTP diphosphatase [Candidatus Gracilibacteria bacterium]|nr:dUTP diphosphatase [Candidatus Gracilibacteria bacterium]MBF0913819.1 dUTP diphosphatase [Candidatus Gracilibacteria bacterium]
MIEKPFFEKVSYAPEDTIIPTRSTKDAAGYDFFASEDIVIPSLFKALHNGETLKPTFVPTHIKAFIPKNMFLQLANRSGNPLKIGISMANGVGIVDADYYNNPDNEGHIQGIFWNMTPEDVVIKKGQKIFQGIFLEYFTIENDVVDAERGGGFGSTGGH